MKKIITLFIALAFYSFTNAQTTYIPDDNFEQALIDAGYDSDPLDDYVPTANIEELTFLNISGLSIQDITGIEDFTFLEILYCQNNQIEFMDISALSYLEELNCSNNSLTALDVSSNTSLNSLDCHNNSMSFLNVKNGNNTNFILFNATSNPALTCIEVDNPSYSITNWINIDPVSNFTSSCGLTFVPDDNFEQALIDLGYDSGSLDDYVPTNNIDGESYLDISGLNIDDLTGIKSFTSLEELYCGGNNISALDLSQMPNLQLLECDDNQLTSLNLSNNPQLIDVMCFDNPQLASIDFSQNPNLTHIDCSNNGLIELDLSSVPALTNLTCNNNNLTELDLSQNLALERLTCHHNLLENLDLSVNTNLFTVICYNNQLVYLNVNNGNNTNTTNNNFKAYNNPQLYCVQVDDVTYSTNTWTNIDAQTSFSTDCSAAIFTYVPDDNFEQALIDLGYDSGPLDDYVLTANITNITYLYLGNKNISTLTGIEDFASLENLTCANNNINELDVSQNLALEYLACGGNNFNSLDLSSNTNLRHLSCRASDLTTIDLSSNTQLTIVSLGMSGSSHGILESIDLSNNPLIEELDLEYNNLTNLDVSNLANLRELNCGENFFTTVDVSNNPLLEVLKINGSLNGVISSLDISNNTQLSELYCAGNQLTSLDVSNNTLLRKLYCSFNNLTELDLSQNHLLERIQCRYNDLTSLNVKNGNNSSMGNYDFRVNGNPDLYCIEVDDVEYSNTNWSNKDYYAQYSEDCGSEAPHVVSFELKVFLEGPYDSGTQLMNTNLLVAHFVPLEEPYTSLGFNQVNGGGEHYYYDDYFSIYEDEYSFVDWIFVEFRDGDNPQNILKTSSLLVARNGSIGRWEYNTVFTLDNINANSFIIAIRHRNHFGVRTLNPVPFTYNGQVISLDFTDPALPLYGGNLAMKTINGVRVMIAGDANNDGAINPVDKNNYWRLENGNPYDYYNSKADFNLDGAVNPVDKNNYWRINNGTNEQLD